MAADETIRVVVKVNPSRHPELHEALKNNGGRAERIRSLALIALSGMAETGEFRPDPGRPADHDIQEDLASNSVESEQPVIESPRAVNDERAKSVGTLQFEAPPKPEKNPHKDLRASVMRGVKILVSRVVDKKLHGYWK